MRSPTQRYAGYIIAIVMFIAAILGLLYNAMTFFAFQSGAMTSVPQTSNLPYFEQAFCLMSFICVCCYLAIVAASVGIFVGSHTAARVMAMILIFEVLYFFSIGFYWLDPTLGMSIAAATGIANGGMMVQFLTLLPIITPIALLCFGLYRKPNDPNATNSLATNPYTD